jgi:formylglycine-generating enzyme required for sulfatase activity
VSSPPPPLTQFLTRLSQAGLDVSVEGVMDAFWLALQPGLLRDFWQSAPVPVEAKKPGELVGPEKPVQPPAPKPDDPQPADPKKPVPPPPPPIDPDEQHPGVFSAPALKDARDSLPASPLRIPAGVALACKLPLTRSLRPLRKWFRNPQIQELDEEGTVEETARSGRILVPVLQPARERWYELVLVADSGSSMDVWQETLNEFEQVARTSGVFRDIRRYRLSWLPERPPEAKPEAKALPPEERAMLTSANGIVARAIQLAQTNVRRMVLIATNGAGTSWTDGTMAALMKIWSRQCTVAILQMLPEHLWPRVHTGEPSLLLRTLSPGTTARSLDARALWWDDDLADEEGNPAKRVEGAVPILPLDPRWMGKWAGMQMGDGQWVPGIATASLDYAQMPPAAGERPPDYWYRVVSAFERSVSPEARLLAVYLSQGTFTLPVARLVQTAKLAGLASQTQLAEILLSGLVERTTPADAKLPPEWVEYRFQPEAALVLSRGLRETDKEEIARALAAHIEHYWGRPVDFQALVYDPAGQAAIPAWAQPFVKLGSLLSNVPPDPDPPDDGRPTVFIVWLTPSLQALGFAVAHGVRNLGIRVLLSGRHRVPAKGVVLMITEFDPNAAYLTDELLRANQLGLDEIVLWGPGARATFSTDLEYDRYSAPEELFKAVVQELQTRSQDPAPPVKGAPPVDREPFTWGRTHSDLFDRVTTSTSIVYSNEAFDAISAVRDVVWRRDLRLKFPAGVLWLQPGEEIPPQPDRLLVIEKLREPVPIPSGCGCVLIDPDFFGAAASGAMSVYEGAPLSQEQLLPLAHDSMGRQILYRMPSSRHLLAVVEHLSLSRSWARISPQVLKATDEQNQRKITESEIFLRTAIFDALDPASREYAGKLAALREGAHVLIGEPLLSTDNVAGLAELDLLEEGSPPRATPTARYIASHHSDWGTWNVNALETFGLSPTSDWYEVSTREPYIRRNLIFHIAQARNLDYIENVISDFRWWHLRIANEGTSALVADLRGVTDKKVFASIGRLVDSIPDLTARTAEEIASWIVSYDGNIAEVLRRSAAAFLKSQELSSPDTPKRFILLAGSRGTEIRDVIRWTADAIGREIARKGFGLMCGVEPGSDQAAIAGFSEESRLRERDPARALRIVTYQDHPQGAELPPGTSVRIAANQAVGSVGLADYIILLGGADWVKRVYDEATSAGKPVYPVPGTESAAEHLFAQQPVAIHQSSQVEANESQTTPSPVTRSNPLWARPIRDLRDAQAVAAALLDQIAGPPLGPTDGYPPDLLQHWNDYLDPASDTRNFFDWKPVTPQLAVGTLLQLLESSQTGERLIAFTSFWAHPASELAAQVGAAAVRGLESAQPLTEWYVLLGACEVLLLEADAFPGENFPTSLGSVLEKRRVQVSSRLESARGRQVHDRLEKLDRQIEAWIQAVRLPPPGDPSLTAAEHELGRLQPVHGRYELENHLKRTQGWAYRLYAYAVLGQNPDASLMDLLIDCLVEREDRSPSLDLGFRTLVAMAKGHPLSDEQVSRLASSQGSVAAKAAKLINVFRPPPTPPPQSPTPYPVSLQPGQIAISFLDDPAESHGPFVITRGVHEVSLPQDYRMGTYPVTNQLFLEFVQQQGYLDDSLWEGQSRRTFLTQDGSSLGPGSWPSSAAFPSNKGNHPVAQVSYVEAQAFARWLQGTRPAAGWTWCIPPEDMWELCARSRQGLLYPWGSEFRSGCCNSQESGLADTSEVGQFSQGNSINGCADMAGNVWEFVVGDTSAPRCVLRGGSYKNNQFEIRNCFRLVEVSVTYRAPDFGIRCCQVRTPDAKTVPHPTARPAAPRKKEDARRRTAKKKPAPKKK